MAPADEPIEDGVVRKRDAGGPLGDRREGPGRRGRNRRGSKLRRGHARQEAAIFEPFEAASTNFRLPATATIGANPPD